MKIVFGLIGLGFTGSAFSQLGVAVGDLNNFGTHTVSALFLASFALLGFILSYNYKKV